MSIPVNFNGVEPQEGGQGGAPLPDGDYIVRIDKATEIQGRTNGTPGIECTMVVLVGDHKNRLLWDTVWITPKTLGMVRHKLDVMGIPVTDGPFSIEPDHFLGRRVTATVRQETYEHQGDTRTKNVVKGWQPAPSTGGPDPLASTGDPFAKPAGNDIPAPAAAAPTTSDADIPF